jgi:hypothetical protein
VGRTLGRVGFALAPTIGLVAAKMRREWRVTPLRVPLAMEAEALRGETGRLKDGRGQDWLPHMVALLELGCLATKIRSNERRMIPSGVSLATETMDEEGVPSTKMMVEGF